MYGFLVPEAPRLINLIESNRSLRRANATTKISVGKLVMSPSPFWLKGLSPPFFLNHISWNTRKVGTQWLPTFPNARYLFGATQ